MISKFVRLYVNFFFSLLITITGIVMVILGGLAMTWPIFVWGDANSYTPGVVAEIVWLVALFVGRITIDSPVEDLVDEIMRQTVD